MAYLNNIYGNAAFVGFYSGMFFQQGIKSDVAGGVNANYAPQLAAAVAMAVDVDALITFDALVTTGSNITQLAITTNTIAANEQFRGGLLQALCFAVTAGQVQLDATIAASRTARANAIHAAWAEGITGLVTP